MLSNDNITRGILHWLHFCLWKNDNDTISKSKLFRVLASIKMLIDYSQQHHTHRNRISVHQTSLIHMQIPVLSFHMRGDSQNFQITEIHIQISPAPASILHESVRQHSLLMLCRTRTSLSTKPGVSWTLKYSEIIKCQHVGWVDARMEKIQTREHIWSSQTWKRPTIQGGVISDGQSRTGWNLERKQPAFNWGI